MTLRVLFAPILTLALQAQSSLTEIVTRGPLAGVDATLIPTTDAERLGLGIAQTLRALEHLGQGLHRHGSKARILPVLRLPVPVNPAPKPIDAEGLRRLLKTFQADLAASEATLKNVKEGDFKVVLSLGRVMLDLDDDGKPTDRLLDLASTLRGGLPEGLAGDLEIAFDATDAAWLRGYTHLLMGLTDLLLAIDLKPHWNTLGPMLFERPILGPKARPRAETSVTFGDPRALGRMRHHLVAMCALSRTTWGRALAEVDDDREWLPSPTQKGVLGVPVRREMVEAWLAMIGDLEGVLEGRLLLPSWGEQRALGFDLKAFLEDPPRTNLLDQSMKKGPPVRYLRPGPRIDTQKLGRAMSVFGGEFMGMAIWFN